MRARAAVGVYGVSVYVLSRKCAAGCQQGWDHTGSNERVCGFHAATHSRDHSSVRMRASAHAQSSLDVSSGLSG